MARSRESRANRLDLQHITDTYFADFMDPDVINEGWCYVWAWMAWLHHPELSLAVYPSPPRAKRCNGAAHAIVIGPNGLYYDSGCPLGSRYMARLGYFRGTPSFEPERPDYSIVRVVEPEIFKRYWGNKGFDDQKIPRWTTQIP